ncbi:MAG: phosphate ABC transporter permease PstA [Actinobacteria bacterium]|nr:phosphate ABC transporter permease PstA [Actinomycetota bacterium]
MTATVVPPAPPTPRSPSGSILRPRKATGWRRFKSGLASVLFVLAFVAAAIPLIALVYYVTREGLKVFSWEFLTTELPFSQRSVDGGIGPAVVGTIVITVGATLMAVPLGVLGGIYLNEYAGKSKFGALVRFLSEILTGVPSIVMGLFIYTFWVLRVKEQTGFAGSLALACLMLPVVIRTSEEMLKLVPHELREGSLALGSRKSRTIRTVVLPHAAPGIVSGSLLAVARAAGETAPLLFTIGATQTANWNLFEGTNTALSVQIFGNANSPYIPAQERAFGAAFTLILIVFVATALARIVTVVYTRRVSGKS